jgi:tryptophan synthase beta chain
VLSRANCRVQYPFPVTQTPISPDAKPADSAKVARPDGLGRFGQFGGKYVPETLMPALLELEQAFYQYRDEAEFKAELDGLLRDYVGRASPLYFAERLTAHYRRPDGSGPDIYLKREDLNHTGAHKINNALGQVLLAKRMGKPAGDCRNRGRSAWGGHRHCVCPVWPRLRDLYGRSGYGAPVPERVSHAADGSRGAPVSAGTGTLKDATSEAIRDWVTNVETTHYILGSVAGPHPYPMMVRDFHAIIGEETRAQCQEKFGGLPDILMACVGGGSNAMGLFHEFVEEPTVRMIGIEAAGSGVASGKACRHAHRRAGRGAPWGHELSAAG